MDFMDVTCGINGQGTIPDEKEHQVKQSIYEEAKKAIQEGYKIFQVGVVGPASMLYGNAVLDAIAEQDGISLEVVLPYPGWINDQGDAPLYSKFMKVVHGSCFADTCYNPAWEMLVNNSVLDLSAKLIAVHDGKNEEISSIVRIAEEIETPIAKVTV